MNGLTPPSGSGWAVNVLDRSAMKADIARARATGADVVIVSIHNGVEYQREPSASQVALERAMAEAGADAVLGSHPHVVQPMEVITITRADGTTREAFIAHSLGNFVSGQRQRYRDAGIMVRLSFSKDLKTGVTSLVGVEYVPTWVDTADQNGAEYRILPIGEVLADDDYEGVSNSDRQRMRQAYADTTKHLGSIEATSSDAAGVVFWGEPDDAR